MNFDLCQKSAFKINIINTALIKMTYIFTISQEKIVSTLSEKTPYVVYDENASQTCLQRKEEKMWNCSWRKSYFVFLLVRRKNKYVFGHTFFILFPHNLCANGKKNEWILSVDLRCWISCEKNVQKTLCLSCFFFQRQRNHRVFKEIIDCII